MHTKQIIIFRKDLLKGENGIRKGKFGAQCAHASLCAFLSWFEMKKSYTIDGGLCEPNKQFFEMLYKAEFHGQETITCLGVGPYLSEELDKVTKDLFNLKPL